MKASIRFTIINAMLALCFSLVAATGVMAQTATTGTIEGTVVDTNGAAIPGVVVTVTSPNLIRAQTATTDSEGRYRILNLPPGRYTVVIEEAGGFARFEQANVEINLSKTSNVTATLQPAGAGNVNVDVSASSGAAVDTSANTTGTNVSTDQFSNFPTQRTVQSLYSIAPTVTRSGLRDAAGRDRDPSVAGSSGPENNYILDGVNTTDPAFGGSGANLPFEFVQEVEIKTGAYGAEYGKATGGIFNVITKSGGNEFSGDAFAYFTSKNFVRETKNFSFTASAPNGFSEIDAGFDIGGPIIKDKLWFFGAFNPQRRENFLLTQFFRQDVSNRVTTPFYAGKLTWALNDRNTFTFSTFADFTKQEGFLFLFNAVAANSGFGADPNSFLGEVQTGGHNYTARLNSTITPTWIGEFSFGMHFQRANIIPDTNVADVPLAIDNFAVVNANNQVLAVNRTNLMSPSPATAGLIAFVDGRGGSLQRNYVRQGFGLVTDQDRNRYEFSARLQNLWGKHSFKYGFEYNSNRYKILTRSSGGPRTFADPTGQEVGAANPANILPGGIRITNNFGVCTAQGTNLACPSARLTANAVALIAAGLLPGIATATTDAALTAAQLNINPVLIRTSTRVRDFFLNTQGQFTTSNVESFYVQDDYKLTRNVQVNFGLRWDYQQANGINLRYLSLNSFKDNLQPRAGLIWDFTGKGKGKLFINYARYLETPLPLDLNVRAGGDDIQQDKQINVSEYNAPANATVTAGTAAGLGCLGCVATPIDQGLKPQTVNEVTAGIEYEALKDLTLGFRGVYRTQGSVIEDGSFDGGTTYFLFNPGEIRPGDNTTEEQACSNPAIGCFGRARRYYRALEFTATKRFSNNYQFIASYVYSSLIGNYEGLFRNDNGQTDPNITSLFDLVALLNNQYGRLPNDRPHQLKFDGSYQTPFKLLIGGSFRAQSGTPFNALIPDPNGVYGNNEGFLVPRGTAINPITGSNRTPTTYNLDLNAYYPIQFGEKRQLRFQVDWFNVFNSQRAITQDLTLRTNSGISGANNIQFFNPFYGTGQIFQFPSALRLGVKFQF